MYTYRRKVSSVIAKPTYLWGSESTAQIKPNMYAENFLLVVVVEETGDPIKLSYMSRNSHLSSPIGVLQAGEVFGITLGDVEVVLATCATEGNDSSVVCSLVPNRQ